jgi:hypothetical protein
MLNFFMQVEAFNDVFQKLRSCLIVERNYSVLKYLLATTMLTSYCYLLNDGKHLLHM